MSAMDRGFRIWLVATLKGGVRKTTTTMLIAFELARRGTEVLVIDADIGTQGVSDWASKAYAAGAELPFHVVQWSGDGELLVPFVLRKRKETGAAVVIVDMGGEAPHVLRDAVPLADRVISPVGAEQAELGRIPATAALVAPSAAEHLVLLTRVPEPGRGSARDARDTLEAGGYRVLATEIGQSREKYAHIWGTVPRDHGAYEQVVDELEAA